MKKIKLPFYFWFVSLFFIVLCLYFMTIENALIDINIHDTYFIIHNSQLSILFTIVYTFIGCIYFGFSFSNIDLNTLFTNIHAAITLVFVPLFLIGYYVLENKENSNFPLFDNNSNSEYFLFILGFLFVIAQLLFVLNVIFSLSKFLVHKK